MTMRHLALSSSGRWCLAIGQQGFDVLNREARIGAVKPDRRVVVCQCPLIERLGVLGDRGRRRTVDMWKESIENERGLVCKVLDVRLEITVVDCEEA